MKKVLGLIGSPRKSGNCETIIKEISRQMPQDHELTLLRLPDFDVKHCTGCYTCLFKESCHLKDDFYRVLEQIKMADGLIVAAPAYMFAAHASLKNFLDRGLAFYRHSDQIWGKPAVAVALAGIEGKEGRTLLDLEGILMGLGSERKKSAILYGALPGEAILNEKNKHEAKEFAEALFAEEPEQKEICCSLCGGQSFRFSSGTQVRCLLCFQQGTIEIVNGVPRFHMKMENDIMLSSQAAADHGEWLKGMKNRFHEQKAQLKEVKLEYRKDGKWFKPLPASS